MVLAITRAGKGQTYIEPLLPGPVAQVIARERPDALLGTLTRVGGGWQSPLLSLPVARPGVPQSLSRAALPTPSAATPSS